MKALKGSSEEKPEPQPSTSQLRAQEDRFAVLREEIAELKARRDQAEQELEHLVLAIGLGNEFGRALLTSAPPPSPPHCLRPGTAPQSRDAHRGESFHRSGSRERALRSLRWDVPKPQPRHSRSRDPYRAPVRGSLRAPAPRKPHSARTDRHRLSSTRSCPRFFEPRRPEPS